MPAAASTDLTFSVWLQEKLTPQTQPLRDEVSSLVIPEGIAAEASALCAFCAAVIVPNAAVQLL